METKTLEIKETKLETKEGLRTWIEIDKEAIKHNYNFFRSLIKPEIKLLAVVKSNAYGHDLVKYGSFLAELGADWLGVDAIEEAIALRAAGIKLPILVLGYTLPLFYPLAAHEKVTLTLSGWKALRDIEAMGEKIEGLEMHLKVDTGLHRQGFAVEELEKVTSKVKELKGLKITGFYSHLGAPTEAKWRAETEKQFERFEEAKKVLASVGLENLLAHICATGGTLFYPEKAGEMARVGMGLYGHWPSVEAGERLEKEGKKLWPALIWKTLISEIKEMKKGERVGYGFSEELGKDSKIAICPVGYWHGYPRALSGKGEVVIKGKRAKVLGRVTMDMIVVDVTEIDDLKEGDEVTLIGEGISAEELAEKIDTSPYEFLTRLNSQIPRIYI